MVFREGREGKERGGEGREGDRKEEDRKEGGRAPLFSPHWQPLPHRQRDLLGGRGSSLPPPALPITLFPEAPHPGLGKRQLCNQSLSIGEGPRARAGAGAG